MFQEGLGGEVVAMGEERRVDLLVGEAMVGRCAGRWCVAERMGMGMDVALKVAGVGVGGEGEGDVVPPVEPLQEVGDVFGPFFGEGDGAGGGFEEAAGGHGGGEEWEGCWRRLQSGAEEW